MTEKKLSREEHENYCQKILEKAKLTVKAFAMDQDGTLKGGNDEKYKKADVAELLKKIARKGKYPIIITASGASALRSFSSLTEFYKRENVQIPISISIGNGAALYRFDKNGITEIYNNKLSLEEVKAIIEIWKQVYSSLNIKETELQQKGIETFKNFANIDWGEYLPEECVNAFKQYNGRCFTEEIKVTFVFPAWEESRQRELVKKLQERLDSTLGSGKYSASRGDDTFLHVTRSFEIDTKLFALQEIIKHLKIKEDEIAAFGDLPFDNDKGLLIESNLKFSFTNSYFEKTNLENPPFILPHSSESAVGSVHKAIEYLLA